MNVQITADSSTSVDVELANVRLLTTTNFTFDGVLFTGGGFVSMAASNLTCYWMAIGY